MILVGLRYAATSFKYDVEALGINDLNTGEVWVSEFGRRHLGKQPAF